MAAIDTREKVAALGEKYKYGFVTDIEMERAPKGLSEDTVKSRMRSIMTKLGALDRTHAVMIAVQRGFLDS